MILLMPPAWKWAVAAAAASPARGHLVLPYGCMEGDMWQLQAQLALPDVTVGNNLL